MPIDPARLKSNLLNTGLQQKDNPLYQVLVNILDNLIALGNGIGSGTGTGGGGDTFITNNNTFTGDLLQQLVPDMGVDGSDSFVPGPQGPVGFSGSSTSVFNYRALTTSQTASDPGTPYVKWNTVGQLDATALYFDWITDDGFDVHIYFELTGPTNQFIVQDRDAAFNYQLWQITSPPINHPDWFEVPCTLVASFGSAVFANKQQLAVAIVSSIGPTGPTGPAGIPGNTGFSIDGVDGVDGFPGVPGPAGSIGPIGSTGPTGSNGIIGLDGVDGLDWPPIPGPIGLTGFTGNPGVAGLDGADGSDGFLGPQGTPGANGLDAKTIAFFPEPEGVIESIFGPINPNVQLPANIAFNNIDNNFVAQTLAVGSTISGVNGILNFIDTTGGVDQKRFRIILSGGSLALQSLNDANTTVQSQQTYTRLGDYTSAGFVRATTDFYEKARPNALGSWINQPFTATDYTGTGGTWTIGSAAVITNRYMLIGKTLFWQLYISWFSGSNVAGGAGLTSVNIAIPGGFTAAAVSTLVPVALFVDNGAVIQAHGGASAGTAQFARNDFANIAAGAAGTAVGIVTTLFVEIA